MFLLCQYLYTIMNFVSDFITFTVFVNLRMNLLLYYGIDKQIVSLFFLY